MIIPPFEFIEKGLTFFRDSPNYGSQDVGIAPGGPMDRLAVLTGNTMLDQEDFAVSLEIVIPPVLKVLRPFCFVLTGAPRQVFMQTSGNHYSKSHGEVIYADRGTRISFGEAQKGFRTYFLWKTLDSPDVRSKLEGRARGDFYSHFTFYDRDGAIRILPGPEEGLLENQKGFTDYHWKVSSDSNEMGYRLTGPPLRVHQRKPMVSDAVSDGTVQLTPSGPIILLYHRQTVGGYPRIYQVISADLDRVSQYSPGEHMRFRLISIDRSMEINRIRSREIGQFRSRFSEDLTDLCQIDTPCQ